MYISVITTMLYCQLNFTIFSENTLYILPWKNSSYIPLSKVIRSCSDGYISSKTYNAF